MNGDFQVFTHCEEIKAALITMANRFNWNISNATEIVVKRLWLSFRLNATINIKSTVYCNHTEHGDSCTVSIEEAIKRIEQNQYKKVCIYSIVGTNIECKISRDYILLNINSTNFAFDRKEFDKIVTLLKDV